MIYIILAIIFMFLFILYMFFKAHHDTIDFRTIHDVRLPASFNDFRIFFISDIHRRNINDTTLKSIKNTIDAVIIGGDLTEKGVPLERTINNIKKLKKWNAPIYFVWGNNDYEEQPEKLHSILMEEDVIILANAHKDIVREGQTVSLLGLDCCTYREARIDLAQKTAKGEYFILTTHAPKAFDELDPNVQDKIHFVLAGHTHGGQIRILGMGPYERGGLQKHRATYKLVSEGYGYTGLPFRLGTNSECHVLHFLIK